MPTATYSDLFGADLLDHIDATDAGSLWQDTGGTTPAVDGSAVLRVDQQSDATISSPFTATNGPTYRANYAASGYPALEFDGVNDALELSDAGFTVGGRFFVLACYTWAGGTTLWCRGNGAAWCRGYASTTAAYMQANTGPIASSLGIPSGRRVSVWVAGADQGQVDSLGHCAGHRSNNVDATLSAFCTIGALNTGTLSQWGAFALHELLCIGGSCEWGQALRAAKLMRDKFNVTDPNASPQVSGGVSGLPLGRAV